MFELSQLRCFVVVAEELHFGRAALRLHLTQPPLSRQIQLLENRLGVRLLERSSRSVRLTNVGRGFLSDARHILRLAEDSATAVRRAAQGESGQVTIGFTSDSGYGVMPGVISRCRARLPEVAIHLREMVIREQIDGLAHGALDLALLRPNASLEEFASRRIMCEPLVAALPETHPLAHGSNPAMGDFDGIPFIMYSPTEALYLHDLVASLFSLAGVKPKYGQFTAQIHSILALVAAGVGVALVPETATRLQFAGVAFRRVRNVRTTRPAELYIAWRRENDNPARQSVLEACLEHIGGLRSDEEPLPMCGNE